ncbi:MAG: 5-dehydro-2-deoxygluconokinase, partial [Alphaproteobacteria bacterium]|nr:5-dehydro-2-deoxygluconokinase [Alphaproteobacteria bacterium]
MPARPEPSRRLDVVTLGRSSVDLYGEQVGGRLEDMQSFAKYVGGCPTNIAVGTARLGLRSAVITRVGDEQMGRFIRETLAAEGVDVSHVSTDPRRMTALVILGIRDGQTFPHIFVRENCADMAIEPAHIDPAFIASASALVVTGTHLSKPGVEAASKAAIAHAKKAGTKVVFDIDYRPVIWGLTGHAAGESRFVASADVTKHLQTIIPDCDLVVGTEEELHIAGGSTDTLAACRAIRALTRAPIVVKRGALGSTVLPGPIPANIDDGISGERFKIVVFNTLGAGDAFMSGFLRGWLRGMGWQDCSRLGNACGALVVARHGCAPA